MQSKQRREHDDVINENNFLVKMRKELGEDIDRGLEEMQVHRKYSLIIDIDERKQVIKKLKAKRPEN